MARPAMGILPVHYDAEIQLTTPPQEFIETRLKNVDSAFDSIDPSFESSPNFSDATTVIEDIDTDDVAQVKADFVGVVKRFNKVMRTGRQDVDLEKERFTWEDVISAMKEAETQYLTVKDAGRGGQLRECFRKCERLNGPVMSWLRLLPSESWQGSLICGGLKIIVGAAAQLGEVREEIIATIQQTPVTINAAESYRLQYPDSSLEGSARQVIKSVLQVMQECLEWFMRKPVKKVFGALVRGKEYEKDLSNKLKTLKAVQDQMDRNADIALHRSIGDVSRRISEMDEKSTRENHEVLNQMKSLLADQQKLKEVVLEREAHRLAKKDSEARLAKIAQALKEALLFVIQYDEDEVLHDLEQSLKIGYSLSDTARARASWILGSEQARRWIESTKSTKLIINVGEADSNPSHSAASFFSAMLVHTLRQPISPVQGDDVVLYWFCGQHVRDDLTTMFSSLLAQLLQQGLDVVSPDTFPKRADWISWTVSNLLIQFVRCLRKQLLRSRVLIVIDSISLYEDWKRSHDLMTFWRALDDVMQNGGKGHQALKVLVTSPMQCSSLGSRRDITHPSVLWVPIDLPGS